MLRLICQPILIIILFTAGFLPLTVHAQDFYDGQVLNKTTEQPIPGATVSLAKEKIASQTNSQGYFKLVPDKALLDDTLIFSYVGYKTYRLPVSKYERRIFIPLEVDSINLKGVTITNRKIKYITLNQFHWSDIKEVHSKFYQHATKVVYARQGIAKLFDAPQPNVTISNIKLGRRDYEMWGRPHSTANRFTKFLVHIMRVATTGDPGKIVFTKEVSLDDNSQMIDIDLTDEHVFVPANRFFVAVEWERVPYNEIITVADTQKQYRKPKNPKKEVVESAPYYSLLYQPFLVGYEATDPAHTWVKDDKKWTMQKAGETDFALSATIHY